ncbi:MAG TPA: type I restriction endonuclease subunit R [Clostridiales bacterium]|nr:type I restriction endonuclease subunit R [Clostridiales bacterium]
MFDECNAVEKLVLGTLAPTWRYIPCDELKRQHSDVMAESMVQAALIKLNPEIAASPDRADDVIYQLRSIILSVAGEGLVHANERMMQWFRGEHSMPFGENGEHVPVRLFDYDRIENNDYIITNQWIYPKVEGGKRFDIVLLINGFPVVIGEAKSPVRPAVSWVDGADDINNIYEKVVPQMFVPNVFSFATEGKCFRYGSVCMPIDIWGPWHSPRNKKEGQLTDVARSVGAMLQPEIVLDIMKNFTVFATDKKHRRIKIICRYQQYEAANLIVQRVVEGKTKKGLIWHFQGSGKSLLMVFAAQKMRLMESLRNPTVMIVVDRIDLDTQITATFNASDIPNMIGTNSRQELMKLLKDDTRKIIITTIHKFGEAEGLLNERSNIILMVDEAHRTQEGDLGQKMRAALPNAFLFGLTGTPINRSDRNTYWAFGAECDEHGYLSRYSFQDSIRDNATLPLHFEAVDVKLHIDKAAINEAFEHMTDQLDEEDKDDVAKKAAKLSILIKSPARVQAVCQHICDHFKEKVEPNSFKAQIVTYDRECCVLYKEELDHIVGPDASAIVMHTSGGKADTYAKWKLSKDEEEKLLDRFRDPADPLKFIIVTSKLLTGFDAPILQAMYLDKPMRDHSLLQAICRTNRVYPGKTHGLIVDYLGIFEDVASALNYDEKSVQGVITNIEAVITEIPSLIQTCLDYFPDVDRTIDGYEGLIAAQECLPNNEQRDKFAADFSVLTKAWEAISPDARLSGYTKDYKWLSQVYESIKPPSGRGKLLWHALGAKTIELVHENITLDTIDDDLETLVLDADILEGLIKTLDARKKGKEIEIKLIARFRKHKGNPTFEALGERLERIKEQHEQGLMNSIAYLKALLELAKDTVEAEQKVETRDEIDKGKAALTELFAESRNENTPIIVERIVNDIDEIVRLVRFPDWQYTTAGERLVRKELRKILYVKYKIQDQELFDKAYGYIKTYY